MYKDKFLLKKFNFHSKVWSIFFAIIISVLIFAFRDKFVHLQGYGYLGLFVLSIVGNATIILPVPVILTAFVAGAVFNPLIVALVVTSGATLGELTGYLVGYGSSDLVEKDLRLQKVKKWIDKFGLWTLFVLAAVPNPFFDLAGIVAGASETPIYKYLIYVWLGKLVKFGILAYLGSHSVVILDKFI